MLQYFGVHVLAAPEVSQMEFLLAPLTLRNNFSKLSTSISELNQ